MMRGLLALLFAVFLVAGCRQPGGAPPPDRLPVPSADERALAAQLAAPPAEGLGRIVFYRQAIPFLQGTSPDLVVNGRTIGSAELGQAFLREVQPGAYEIFSSDAPDSLVVFELRAGRTRYVKAGPAFVGLGFRIAAREVASRRAEAELADLWLRRQSPPAPPEYRGPERTVLSGS